MRFSWKLREDLAIGLFYLHTTTTQIFQQRNYTKTMNFYFLFLVVVAVIGLELYKDARLRAQAVSLNIKAIGFVLVVLMMLTMGRVFVEVKATNEYSTTQVFVSLLHHLEFFTDEFVCQHDLLPCHIDL